MDQTIFLLSASFSCEQVLHTSAVRTASASTAAGPRYKGVVSSSRQAGAGRAEQASWPGHSPALANLLLGLEHNWAQYGVWSTLYIYPSQIFIARYSWQSSLSTCLTCGLRRGRRYSLSSLSVAGTIYLCSFTPLAFLHW